MEELGLDYEMKIHQYTKEHLAPEEMKKIFPTGLAPLLQIFKSGKEEPIALGESGHIILYLIRHYDTTNKLGGETEEEEELIDYYLHFTEGSLQPHIISAYVGYLAVMGTPWPLRFITRGVTGQMNSLYFLKKLKNNLRFLDDHLAQKNGGYFVGDSLSVADIVLDYPLNENLFENPDGFAIHGLDLVLEFPNLYKWHQLIAKEPLRAPAKSKTKANP